MTLVALIFFSPAEAPLPDPTLTPPSTPKRTRKGPVLKTPLKWTRSVFPLLRIARFSFQNCRFSATKAVIFFFPYNPPALPSRQTPRPSHPSELDFGPFPVRLGPFRLRLGPFRVIKFSVLQAVFLEISKFQGMTGKTQGEDMYLK